VTIAAEDLATEGAEDTDRTDLATEGAEDTEHKKGLTHVIRGTFSTSSLAAATSDETLGFGHGRRGVHGVQNV